MNELALWAYITKSTIIVTNKSRDTFRVYTPNRSEMPLDHRIGELETMHHTLTANNNAPAYLVYDGNHYNPLMYAHRKQLDEEPDMPEWVDDTRTTATKPKRKRRTSVIDDSEEDSTDTEANDGTHQRQKRTKTEQKTEDIKYKKRNAEETTGIIRRQRHRITTEDTTRDNTTNQ